jgi:hypothetical protein
MSKQNGVIKLEGTIGGIAFYQSGGQHLARIAKGPSKNRIATDAAFVRTRENNKEFGGAATAAKAMRLSLAAIVQSMSDRYFVSRLTKIFKEICSRDTVGARGRRSILLSANKPVLENLNFDEGLSFSTVFNAPYLASNSVDRDSGTIAIAAFSPATFINAPAGATHFCIIQALGVVSDYNFNTNMLDYEPLEPALNSIGIINRSAITALSSTATPAINLVSTLPNSPVLTVDVSVIQCIGIEFYQRVNGNDYIFAQGNAIKIAKLF